mmetsp:Transcript_63455/g.138188  ORF Transcript_63455/g.138188 Transcript_63455/m.138188 type:complete len:530 (+) Transcript_63455:142-1731(+)
MQVTAHNDVKVYNLSSGKSLPQFWQEARKKNLSLRKNEEFRKRIDLIQDFEFNIASSRVRVSADGSCIAASGVYPPEIRLFDTSELGLRCSRGLNAEVVDFIFLSEDYRKLVFLLDDRTVEFHAQYGRHHRIRVPKVGRSICYDSEGCTLLVAGSSTEVIRLDLEAGQFQAPIALRGLTEVNQAVVNPALPVVSCAGDMGLVESYDLRDPSRPIQALQVSLARDPLGQESLVTCCAYSPSGMQFAAGTAAGIVRVYDVRSSKPVAERDHMNGYAMRSVTFHSRAADGELLVGAADCRSVKVWSASDGSLAASVESAAIINDITFCPGTGLFFAANDQQRIGCYFVPSLGLAPKWCSFLDSMTEELEESKQKVVFDDYQFVTTDQLEQLGATNLLGTKFLQPYMHGYFMDHRLHAKLQAAMDPFAYEEFRKKRIRDKVEAKRTMRVKIKKAGVAVNPSLHEKLQQVSAEGKEEGVSKKRREAAAKAERLLTDDRFKVLFDDPDFEIEHGSLSKPAPEEPSAPKKKKLRKS